MSPFGVTPEADGLGRERLGADQFALFPSTGWPGLEYLHRETRPAPLVLAAIGSAQGVADDEAGKMSVPPEMDDRLHIRFDLLVNVVKPSGDSTDPVHKMRRKAGRSWVLMG